MKIGERIIKLGEKIFKKDKKVKEEDKRIKDSWFYLYEPKVMPKIFKEDK